MSITDSDNVEIPIAPRPFYKRWARKINKFARKATKYFLIKIFPWLALWCVAVYAGQYFVSREINNLIEQGVVQSLK